MMSKLFKLTMVSFLMAACGPETMTAPNDEGTQEPAMRYRFEVPGEPTDVALYADGQAVRSERMILDRVAGRLYVADINGQQVKTVDLATHRLIGEVALGGAPMRLSLTGDGKRLLATRGDGALFVIDTSNGHVLGQIPVGLSAQGVAVTPGGRFAYVADPEDKGVALVDTGAGEGGADTTLAVADRVTHAIRFYDGEGRSLGNTLVAVTPSSLAFTPDQSQLVVGFNLGGAPGMAVLDLVNHETKILPMPTPADSLPLEAAPAIDTDGSHAYLVAGRALYVVDTRPGADFGQIQAIRLGSQALSVAVGYAGVAYVLTDDLQITVIGQGPEIVSVIPLR